MLSTSHYLCQVRFVLPFIFCTLIFSVFAQRQQGMITDNYSGNIGIQYNPANLADSRFRFNMNVIGFNAHLQNNYLQVEPPHSIYKFLNWKRDSTFGTQNFDYPYAEDYTKERLNGKDKFIYTNASVNVLSMQFALKNQAGLSFAITTKAYGKVSNLPENSIKTFLQDLDSVGYAKENQRRLLGETIDMSNTGAAALAYQQFSFKYAVVAKDKGQDFFKIGFGVDYNIGLYGGYFKANDVSYTLTGIDTLSVTAADMELAYIDPSYQASPDRRLNDFFGKSRLGRGVGINAGFVYEHRPDNKAYKYRMNRRRQVDQSANKYDWKVGASIIDLGFVNFNNGAAARKLTVSSPTSPKNWNNFDSADTWKNIDDVDTFINTFFSSVEQDSSFRMYTPATLNLSADYKIRENIYLAANYTQSLMRNKGKSVKTPNVLSIAPRYESRWLTVALPVSISRYYNIVNLGAYVRGGIFYVGSDNLGGFLTGKKTNGANIYAGFNWPIHYKKLADSDGDGVSDDEDQCPDMAGPIKTDGCPDADEDGIADDEDKCPNEPGKKRFEGCPDVDEDGLVGEDDECPGVYGGKSTNGCPDRDGDGIHDAIDLCPDIAGEPKYKGCIDAPDEISDNTPITPVPDIIQADSILKPKTKESKFDNWDFATYEYWPVLGAYNDVRWAEELQSRLTTNIGITTTIKSIPGASKYYVTLGQANSLSEAKEIQKILDIPRVNQELNGSLWWKKINK